MPALHSALFQAVATERQNVEDPAVLTNIVKGLVDPVKFRAMLDSGNYAKQIEENNDLAYEKSGVWFVPAFRMISGPETGKKLDAAGGVGIFREQLNDYLGVK
jgi:predicted DsbA family dithiol-disulfide isomerase